MKRKSLYVYIALLTFSFLMGIGREANFVSEVLGLFAIMNFLWTVYAIADPQGATLGFTSSRVIAGLIFAVICIILVLLANATEIPRHMIPGV